MVCLYEQYFFDMLMYFNVYTQKKIKPIQKPDVKKMLFLLKNPWGLKANNLKLLTSQGGY